MIPLMALVGIRNHQGRRFRLWIPLFLLWLLALPFALVLLPLALIGFWVVGVHPFRAVHGVWQALCALRNTHVEVENNNAWILIDLV